MRIGSYLCLGPSKGKIVDLDDDDTPLAEVLFLGDARGLSSARKRMILNNTAAAMSAWWSRKEDKDASKGNKEENDQEAED